MHHVFFIQNVSSHAVGRATIINMVIFNTLGPQWWLFEFMCALIYIFRHQNVITETRSNGDQPEQMPIAPLNTGLPSPGLSHSSHTARSNSWPSWGPKLLEKRNTQHIDVWINCVYFIIYVIMINYVLLCFINVFNVFKRKSDILSISMACTVAILIFSALRPLQERIALILLMSKHAFTWVVLDLLSDFPFFGSLLRQLLWGGDLPPVFHGSRSASRVPSWYPKQKHAALSETALASHWLLVSAGYWQWEAPHVEIAHAPWLASQHQTDSIEFCKICSKSFRPFS